jgi:Uma2 family endonuclease
MAMPAIRRHWTTVEVRDLIDESKPWPRFELINGELFVTPSPGSPHQLAVTDLAIAIGAYLGDDDLRAVLVSPADLELQPESITQPDVFVVPLNPDAEFDPDNSPTWKDVERLILAVEVISPSSVRIDRVDKRDFYMQSPVDEYWVVDLDARAVERWIPDRETPEILRESIEWHPAGATTPFSLDLEEFFQRIWTKNRHLPPRFR